MSTTSISSFPVPALPEIDGPVIRFADDVPLNLKVFQKQAVAVLKIDPSRVQLVETIDQAYEKIDGLKFILLDYTFDNDTKGRTGATAAHEIHKIKRNLHPSLTNEGVIGEFPLIIGYSGEESGLASREFQEAGAIKNFKKPVQSKDLFAFIKTEYDFSQVSKAFQNSASPIQPQQKVQTEPAS